MTTKKKMLPIGIENFEEIITQGFYYIDKTGLIRDLLNDWAKVTLFTRPRRFGKTLNMSMLRYFFEIGSEPKLFDGLTIAKEQNLCKEYMGKFPVISISLKSVEGMNFDDARAMFAQIITNEARRHSYLMNSNHLEEYEKQNFEALLTGNLTDDSLKNSLWFISLLLYKHHNQKVVILIDEYDVPLSKAYDYGYYDQMVILIRNVLHQALKTNDNLQMAVLTGCMRIAKESIFTGLNNLNVVSLTNAYFDEYFGFTDNEVVNILSYYGLEEKHSIIKAWYDGYTFGNQAVYCPWDVLKYAFDQRKNPNMPPQNYWSNTSSNDIIRKLLNKADDTTRWDIEQLMEGKNIEKAIFQELTYAELEQSIDHLWSVLFTTGYLTYEREHSPTTSAMYDTFGAGLLTEMLQLKIPNEEIRSIFKNHIYTWFNDSVATDADRYKSFSQAFIDGDEGKNELPRGKPSSIFCDYGTYVP